MKQRLYYTLRHFPRSGSKALKDATLAIDVLVRE